jgi:beta-glucosidase
MADDRDPFQPLPFDEAHRRAVEVVAEMSLDEKIALVGGDRSFFIRPIPRLGTPEVYMTDATGGIHLREAFDGHDLARYQPEKSTAFPCPLALAATWDPALARRYARAVGKECRAKRIGILLGPGMNIYRHAQCGRNFEYLGEDPFLAARIVEAYVDGVQSTGTMATLKHFVANETDWYRRRSNSIVDERALHEIFLPAFEAGVNAGARAVMTAYNLLDGEWCGQSERVIGGLLRGELGFRWLVMSDGWSVYDGPKLARSGQDLEMPHAVALRDAHALVERGLVRVEDLERMAASVLAACFSMRLDEPTPEPPPADFDRNVAVALETARQGIVLLHDRGGVLPIAAEARDVLVTGPFVEEIAVGGGSARVKGFDHHSMLAALRARLGSRVRHVPSPTPEELRAADLVICKVGSRDSEGYDRPFALPDEQERAVRLCVEHNARTVVVVNAGGGVRMTDWHDRAAALLYAWYPGQIGNVALAEILTGAVNPSGKLPITIEREFADSPGAGYLPEGEALYEGFRDEEERRRPVWDLRYHEGVFVGYRWYEHRGIEPLYPFGHGRSYTAFAYEELEVVDASSPDASVEVRFTLRNVGARAGAEIAQVYVEDVDASVPRPRKELKGFARVELAPGAAERIAVTLAPRAFQFWHPELARWTAEPGAFRIHVGASSRDLRLSAEVQLR